MCVHNYFTVHKLQILTDIFVQKFLNDNGTKLRSLYFGNLWCEVLSIEFGVSNEDILNNVKNNISNYIDLEKSISQNDIDLWDFNIESEEARNIIL